MQVSGCETFRSIHYSRARVTRSPSMRKYLQIDVYEIRVRRNWSVTQTPRGHVRTHVEKIKITIDEKTASGLRKPTEINSRNLSGSICMLNFRELGRRQFDVDGAIYFALSGQFRIFEASRDHEVKI